MLLSLSIFFPMDKHSEVKLLDHVVVLFLTCGGSSILFSIVTTPVYIPTKSALVISSLVDISHSNRSEVKSHCCFDLHFPEFQINKIYIFSLSLFQILQSSLFIYFCFFEKRGNPMWGGFLLRDEHTLSIKMICNADTHTYIPLLLLLLLLSHFSCVWLWESNADQHYNFNFNKADSVLIGFAVCCLKVCLWV